MKDILVSIVMNSFTLIIAILFSPVILLIVFVLFCFNPKETVVNIKGMVRHNGQC